MCVPMNETFQINKHLVKNVLKRKSTREIEGLKRISRKGVGRKG